MDVLLKAIFAKLNWMAKPRHTTNARTQKRPSPHLNGGRRLATGQTHTQKRCSQHVPLILQAKCFATCFGRWAIGRHMDGQWFKANYSTLTLQARRAEITKQSRTVEIAIAWNPNMLKCRTPRNHES